MIPTKCLAVLSKHKDEVWLVRFSPSGQRLATVGKDHLLCLWSLTKQKGDRYRVRCTHEIRGHARQINALAWSTLAEADRWVVTASLDKTAKVWDARSGRLACEVGRHQEAVTAACFLPGNDFRLMTAAVDKLVVLWELRAAGPENFEAVEIARVESRNYLDILIAGSRFVTMGQSHFQVFNLPEDGDRFKEALEEPELSYEVETSDTVTSMALTKDGKHLLLNVSFKEPRLELYNLNGGRANLVRKYKGGHEQSMFVLRCAFGGADEAFVLCGSEDATVAIWHREKAELIARVGTNGHNQAVNCVSWSPCDQYLFASASDDQTVRLWGLEGAPLCEVVADGKDIKRVDLLKAAGTYVAAEDDEDDEDEASEKDSEEESMEDEAPPRRGYPQVVMRAVRGEAIREEEDEEEEDWAGEMQ